MRILLLAFLLAAPASAAYTYRRVITLGQATTSDQTNFDLTVQLDSSNAGTTMKLVGSGGHIQHTVTQTGGLPITIPADFILTTDSTCASRTIPWEVRAYDGSAGSLLARVKVGTLATATHALVYACYGDAAVTTQQNTSTYAPSAVYDSNTIRAFSMSDNVASTVVVDSSAAAVNGVNVANTSSKTVAGQFGTALAFNGSTDYTTAAMDLSAQSVVSVSFWMKWTTNADDDKFAMEFSADRNTNNAFVVDHDVSVSGNTLPGMTKSDGTAWQDTFTRPTAAVWHHYTYVFDRGSPINIAYVDGTVQSLTANTHTASSLGNFANSTLYLMTHAGTALFGAGSMQELHIAGGARSASWAATDAAAGSPLIFNSIGAETGGGSTAKRRGAVIQ